MGPTPSHVVLYVGGESEPSAAAIEAVNRFCDALPGGFGIRVVNVHTRTDCAALYERLPASSVIEREIAQPGRATRRQRAERVERRIERTEPVVEGAAQ